MSYFPFFVRETVQAAGWVRAIATYMNRRWVPVPPEHPEEADVWICYPSHARVRAVELHRYPRSGRSEEEGMRDVLQCTHEYKLNEIHATLPRSPFIVSSRDESADRAAIHVRLHAQKLAHFPEFGAFIACAQLFDQTSRPVAPGFPDPVAPSFRAAGERPLQCGMCVLVEPQLASPSGVPMVLRLDRLRSGGLADATLYWLGASPKLKQGDELWRRLSADWRGIKQDRQAQIATLL
jgi:hypothetical protein